MYFRNEKILFFYWIMLKSGRQARKRWRWWGRNYEFISVRKGNVRLSDNSFVSLSKFLDVKLLLKWVFKIYPYFCSAKNCILFYGMEVSRISSLFGSAWYNYMCVAGRCLHAGTWLLHCHTVCTTATALQLTQLNWFKTAENVVHISIVQLWCL